ncbi:MAG: restriction endonuclease, partial [Oscillospiraceae bacterium]|nr:restriction endonuclease [Oscillospiraceae bacterium]
PELARKDKVDGKYIEKFCKKSVNKVENTVSIEDELNTNELEEIGIEIPDEIKLWRKKLYEIITKMNPYSFEKLCQRLLRESGFDDVVITKKSGDGGIDGTGKLKLNGIMSFNIAFQCKRYQGKVGAPEIRDFRGSLTTDIEKGVFITTGTFSKAALEEAGTAGKKHIDLIDGEKFITMLAELEIGVKEIKDYEINEEYFLTL